MGKLARAAFFVLALPAVLRASLRVAALARRSPLDELAARLRGAPPFAVRSLSRPEWLLASLDRLLPVLPPYGYGRCLKRSLLLLDLWSRCGLRPRLHLAAPVARTAGRHQGHAWVTAEPAGPPFGTSSEGYAEAFLF
jgi:hypothetical protein